MEFLFENWSAIALAILSALGTITALTETEKDDTLVNVLTRIVQAIVFGKSRGLGRKKKYAILHVNCWSQQLTSPFGQGHSHCEGAPFPWSRVNN